MSEKLEGPSFLTFASSPCPPPAKSGSPFSFATPVVIPSTGSTPSGSGSPFGQSKSSAAIFYGGPAASTTKSPLTGIPSTFTSAFSAQSTSGGSAFNSGQTGVSGFGASGHQSDMNTTSGAGTPNGSHILQPQQQQKQHPVQGTGIGSENTFRQSNTSTGCASTFNKFDPRKQEHIEEFLRKSLLGEELVSTQFHLFSARSSSSGRVVKPRFLCVNNVLLAKSSEYFLDLLDKNASDPSLVELLDEDDVPNNARINDFDYESDSDLEDYDEPVPETSKGMPSSHSKASTETEAQLSGNASEQVASDALSLDQLREEEPSSMNQDEVTSSANNETITNDSPDNTASPNQAAKYPRSSGIRRVLVTDTAFQTWYTLLNYLYTNKIDFLPLSSARALGAQRCGSSTSSLDQPKCSVKSLYRLACKVGLDALRDKAFFYIKSSLTEHNILKELSCSLLSKHPQLLEMELDVLYSNIASPPVVTNFPQLARRIANNELAHGADIVIGIHARILKTPRIEENWPKPKNNPRK